MKGCVVWFGSSPVVFAVETEKGKWRWGADSADFLTDVPALLGESEGSLLAGQLPTATPHRLPLAAGRSLERPPEGP